MSVEGRLQNLMAELGFDGRNPSSSLREAGVEEGFGELELMTEIEYEFDILFDDKDFYDVATVGELIDLIKRYGG